MASGTTKGQTIVQQAALLTPVPSLKSLHYLRSLPSAASLVNRRIHHSSSIVDIRRLRCSTKPLLLSVLQILPFQRIEDGFLLTRFLLPGGAGAIAVGADLAVASRVRYPILIGPNSNSDESPSGVVRSNRISALRLKTALGSLPARDLDTATSLPHPAVNSNIAGEIAPVVSISLKIGDIAKERALPSNIPPSIATFFPTGGLGPQPRRSGAQSVFPTAFPTGPIPSGVPASVPSFFASLRGKQAA